MKDTDNETRFDFADFFVHQCDRNSDFINNVLWTDEAHFFLDGCVSTPNFVIWFDSNPHAITPTPLHPTKVTVWAGFTSTQILPPFFSRIPLTVIDTLRCYVIMSYPI